MDDKILFLYGQGLTTREVVTTFKEMYAPDVAIEQVVECKSWHLDAIYPIVYLDCIVVKLLQDKIVDV